MHYTVALVAVLLYAAQVMIVPHSEPLFWAAVLSIPIHRLKAAVKTETDDDGQAALPVRMEDEHTRERRRRRGRASEDEGMDGWVGKGGEGVGPWEGSMGTGIATGVQQPDMSPC